MRSIVAVLIAVLAWGTVLSDSVVATKTTDQECQVFTPLPSSTHNNSVKISVKELRCLGINLTEIAPWEGNEYEIGPKDAQHLDISVHSLGFLLRLTNFLKQKSYNIGAATVLTVDTIALMESHGVELLISKDTDEPADWKLQLQRTRNADVLFMLELQQKEGRLRYVNNKSSFRVVPMNNELYEREFTNKFHPPTLVTVSR